MLLLQALVALLISCMSASQATTVIGKRIALPLSPPDRVSIETFACRQTYGVSAEEMEAYRYEYDPPASIDVFVLCARHDTLDGRPLRYATTCGKTSDKWTCTSGHLEAGVSVSDRPIRVRAFNVPLSEAASIVEVAATANVLLPQSDHLHVTPTCGVTLIEQLHWTVGCTDGSAANVKQLCDDNSCHFEVTRHEWDDTPLSNEMLHRSHGASVTRLAFATRPPAARSR
jgi:hypothetical protein